MLDVARGERRLSTYLVLPYKPKWRRPALVTLALVGALYATFAFFYVRFARRVDARLAKGPFSGTVEIYSAPREIAGPNAEVIRRDPQLITSLHGRDKRRLVHYRDLPPNLVHAVISVEDKHFFHHTGFDLLRMAKAAWVDVKDGRKEQGASTLSMQLARGLWLDPDKSWRRKAEELLITLHLEHKLTKEQIFEDYANAVYLGRRGPFSIQGFGEASRDFFSKDISQLTNDEAALLAGLVQRPSYYNPYRYPDRARERRDLVLELMRDNGYLSQGEYQAALAAPLRLAPEASEGLANQYFIDYVDRELESKLDPVGAHPRAVYTTLDPDLQKAAEDAVRMGMQQVDAILRKRRGPAIPKGEPQVALVALDPHTGEIKAFVGGRNYAESQLDHAVAMRQPGSVFKPMVYAAALETAIRGGEQIFTPATILEDNPTTFAFDGQAYKPDNFKGAFMGPVTLRTALMHSLNVATVSLAQQVGYRRVVDLARRLGLNGGIQATPAVALGAYEATPVEIAESYTAFANRGFRVSPTAVREVRSGDGSVIYEHEADARAALDPRVAYLMVSLMQDVIRAGTGAGVRARGFTLPAAGKTGTSRDGWFAGFTSRLECVVWVGFDDGRDLNLEGSKSALPIWTEFMKRAAQLPAYRDAAAFQAPSGIVSVEICPESGQIACDYCPGSRSEVFIDGTEPTVRCQLHSEPAPDSTGSGDGALVNTGASAAGGLRTMIPLAPATIRPTVPVRSGYHPVRNDSH